MAKGEQESINFKDLKSFSIGNGEVITATYRAQEGKMLVKAKSLGYSDLMLWDKQGNKVKYEIYCNSKTKQVSILKLTRELTRAGLAPKLGPNGAKLEGEINNLVQLQLVQKAQKQSDWLVQVKLNHNFRNQIIGEIYKTLLAHGAYYVDCELLEPSLICQYLGKVDTVLVNKLEQKYSVKFQTGNDQSNYQIRYQIIQVDQSSDSFMKLGIDSISLQLHRALNSSVADLNQLLMLAGNKLNAKVIASPMMLIGLKQKNKLELGSSIPYQNQTQFGTSTQWKFAGLKVANQLDFNRHQLVLNYSAELSHPIGEAVSGSKAQGQLHIIGKEYIKAFEITYENSDQLTRQVPGLGEIPILQHLFSSNRKSKGLKHILGFVQVTRVE